MRASSRQRLLCVSILIILAASPARGEQLGGTRSNRTKISADADSIPTKAKRKLAQAAPTDDAESTWEIFGFTEGSDAGPAGSRGLFHESVPRAGGGVAALGTSSGIVYSPINNSAIWVGLDSSWEHIDNVSGQGTSQGFGPSGGIKYQFLSRDRSPIGLAAQWSFSSIVGKSGNQAYHSLTQEFRLLADWQIAASWFAAVNLSSAPELDTYGSSAAERTHTLELSAAVTKRISERYFIGTELRHLTRYQFAFGALEEQAVYFGPTVLVRFDAGYVGLAWSIRVSDSGAGPLAFGAQLFRLKAGLAF